MPTCCRMISDVEAAVQIMHEWNNDESNTVDTVILPPSNADLLTDDEEVQNNAVIDNRLPSDVSGMV